MTSLRQLAVSVPLLSLLAGAMLGCPAVGCSRTSATAPPRADGSHQRTSADAAESAERRARMVREQIEARGVRDPRVLDAMRRVPRHLFVPEALRSEAYNDYPLPIGYDQTISQPFIVAWMTEALQTTPRSRVLEIGTGSGYQAAVLAEITAEVYTIEILAPLAASARQTIEALGYRNVHARVGDGYAGWPEHAPFDAIIVTAAPDHVPQPLLDQMAMGGRLVIPVGGAGAQQLTVITKDAAGMTTEERMPVRFVPLVRP
jgi:protein-L-isoaspartate(D-aspartate) O-methyltransferase